MDYRIKLAKRMLFNQKGSLIGAVLAVTIGILVINVNFVIFQGLYDAIVRDISEYTTGDVIVTDEFDFIDKSDQSLVRWFERIPVCRSCYTTAVFNRRNEHDKKWKAN